MECVILYRNLHNDRIGFIGDENGDMEVFATRDEAIDLALSHPLLRVMPYQLVELDEL